MRNMYHNLICHMSKGSLGNSAEGDRGPRIPDALDQTAEYSDMRIALTIQSG